MMEWFAPVCKLFHYGLANKIMCWPAVNKDQVLQGVDFPL